MTTKLASGLAVCLLASIAAAQPPAQTPPPALGPPVYGLASDPPHTHDGFYLRMFVGLGYTQMELEDRDVTAAGTGGAFGIAVGAAISENLIGFAEIFDDIATNPTLTMGGVEEDTEDVSAGVVAVGGGLAYYFMPENVYVSGTISFGQLTIRSRRFNNESNVGPGVSLMVGKEWWVSPNWGIGGALHLYGSRVKQNDNAATWETKAIALTFSATYN